MANVTIDEICLVMSTYFESWLQDVVLRNEQLQWCLADMPDITDSSLLSEKKQYVYAFILEAIKTIKKDSKNAVSEDYFVYKVIKNSIDAVTFIASANIDFSESRTVGDELFINSSIKATEGGRKRLYFDYRLSIIPNDTGDYNINVKIENVSRASRK